MDDALIFTCEHAANRIPRRYRDLFLGHEAVLETHRGYDIEALPLAWRLAGAFDSPLFATTVSRLLIEVNRSLHHPRVFSEFSRDLPDPVKTHIVNRYYRPHRKTVEEAVAASIAQGCRVIHIGVHTFTPELDGDARNAAVGLLYDPARNYEQAFCARWREGLRALAPHVRVRRNYPYRGAADGLTTHLRRRFPAARYLGIELEVNQACLQEEPAARVLAGLIACALDQALSSSSASKGK